MPVCTLPMPESTNTALWLVAKEGDVKNIEYWIENGFDVNHRNLEEESSGYTALGIAAQMNHLDAMRILLDHGAETNIKSGRLEWTLLHNACYRNALPVVEILLGAQADINDTDCRGYTALHYAIEKKFEVLVRLLVQKGANIYHSSHCGYTGLHIACIKNSVPIATTLIDAGANVNATDNQGNTPLHYCAKVRWPPPTPVGAVSTEMVLLLIQHGADVFSRSLTGHTPMDLATTFEVKAIIENRIKEIQTAFSMGMHERAGAESRIRSLDPELVRMILDEVAHQLGV
jgi:ankyrin repeat protein